MTLNVAWLLVPDGLDTVFQKLLIYQNFYAQPPLDFYRAWAETRKISSERQLCGWKVLVDVRGQRRLVQDDRQATVAQITFQPNLYAGIYL